MPYTDELKRLIKVVEKTRPERLARKREGKEIPPMSLKERDEILRKYHPDYMDKGKRPIKVGPNKGYKLPDEIVDLLEAKSRIDPNSVDLSQVSYETDVLVIGGGGAGTAAAIVADEQGAKVIIANKLRHGDCNTIMAEGGVQAATKFDKDSPAVHYLDTMGGGRFKNDPEIVTTMVLKAASLVQWLESLGVAFFKFPDGRLQSLPGAGYCRKRLQYSGDVTGTEIMRVLRDEARNRENITVLEFCPAVELIMNDKGQCAGAILFNLETEEYYIVKAKAVILSTGGQGRLHIAGFMTTNHYGATADGIVLGYRAGVGLRDLHAVQYHPTGVVFPEELEGSLISEKFRAAGANMVNGDGEQFVFEREPRDVESAACIRECRDRHKCVPTPTGRLGLWLDSPMLEELYGEGTVKREFPGKHKQFERHGIDISKEPMLIYPVLHYQNGGLVFNSKTETSVPGLFAAGEVAGGVHGENRLMGNSLLEVHLFGRIAGENAAKFAQEKAKEGKLTLDHVNAFHKELEKAGIVTDRVAPMLLPDYTDASVRERQLTAHYVGTLR